MKIFDDIKNKFTNAFKLVPVIGKTIHTDVPLLYEIYFKYKSPCRDKIFVNEHGNKINTRLWERFEQYFVTKHVDSYACVLEIGGRYGIISYCIQDKLINKNQHIVVEPDDKIVEVLKKNMVANKMSNALFHGVISRENKQIKGTGLATYTCPCDEADDSVANTNIENLEPLQNGFFNDKKKVKFDTMMIDCEGCFIALFDEYKDYILENVNTIIIEIDRLPYEKYNKIFEELYENNFKLVDQFSCHIYVLKRNDY